MITPESPDRLYSTRRRTALVLTGSGTAGAYHAGVLRALHETGVRLDLVAGRGMGAASAMFAVVDGGARLWDGTGIWKRREAAHFYRPRRALRVAGWALAGAAIVLLFPLALVALAIAVGILALLLTLVGLEGPASALTMGFTARLGLWFTPGWLPTIVPRLVLLAVLVAVVALAAGAAADWRRMRGRRRQRAGIWRWFSGHPLASGDMFDALTADLWKLIRGAAPLARPSDAELGRRYLELLAENLGQPGFRELLVVVHDVDARHDLVFAFLGERYRARFFGPRAGSGPPRAAEAFDLAGVAREHAVDALSAALALPVATAPHLIPFSPEGPWRGERHRACDRPAALTRLLEEAIAAGAEQIILVSAAARAARPHELSSQRADVRGGGGEQLAAFETATLRDVVEQFTGRVAGLYVIRPDHNPLGPLDFAGVHDERSDRQYALAELVDRGYEDAYRQFVDPVVGAGGEGIEPTREPDASGAARAMEL